MCQYTITLTLLHDYNLCNCNYYFTPMHVHIKVYTRDVWTDALVATINPSLPCNSSPKTHTSGLVFHFYSSSSDECQLSLRLPAKKQTQVN